MLKITYYVFRQLSLTTLFLTIILTAAVWLTQSLRFVDGILNKGLPVKTFFMLVSYLLPDLISIVLPAALLIAIVYTYNRLIADQELSVMRSSGMSQWQLSKPAVVLAFFITLSLYLTNIYLLPNSYTQMRNMEHNLKTTISTTMLQAGEFNTINDLTVYIRVRENHKDMKGILIYDNRDKDQPFLVTAEAGSLIKTPEGMKLVLLNGARQDLDKKTNNPSMLYFDQYMVELETPKDKNGSRIKDVHEYGILDLLFPTEKIAPLEKHGKFKSQGHQRVINPLIALAFCLMAVAFMLSGEINRRRKTKRIVIIASVACLIQLLTLGFINLAEKFWLAVPLAYIVIFATILLPFAFINEWFSLQKPLSFNRNHKGQV